MRAAMKKRLIVTMSDGSRWGVPVEIIARDRAKNYASEFGDDIDRSLAEDTVPLFTEHEFEIIDWAQNNMNWDDVKQHAGRMAHSEPDYQEGWVNGDKELV
jgi:hypothetical protein